MQQNSEELVKMPTLMEAKDNVPLLSGFHPKEASVERGEARVTLQRS